uniref:Uncharacterized protein n=1 Tax=Candidozyma auris TaxID=498019 RepID=A0A0L0P6E5_CANAR
MATASICGARLRWHWARQSAAQKMAPRAPRVPLLALAAGPFSLPRCPEPQKQLQAKKVCDEELGQFEQCTAASVNTMW